MGASMVISRVRSSIALTPVISVASPSKTSVTPTMSLRYVRDTGDASSGSEARLREYTKSCAVMGLPSANVASGSRWNV